RLTSSIGVGVNRLRDEFLASARLPENQCGRRGACDLPDLFVDLAHRRARPDHICVLEYGLLVLLAARIVEGPRVRGAKTLCDHGGDDMQNVETRREARGRLRTEVNGK